MTDLKGLDPQDAPLAEVARQLGIHYQRLRRFYESGEVTGQQIRPGGPIIMNKLQVEKELQSLPVTRRVGRPTVHKEHRIGINFFVFTSDDEYLDRLVETSREEGNKEEYKSSWMVQAALEKMASEKASGTIDRTALRSYRSPHSKKMYSEPRNTATVYFPDPLVAYLEEKKYIKVRWLIHAVRERRTREEKDIKTRKDTMKLQPAYQQRAETAE